MGRYIVRLKFGLCSWPVDVVLQIRIMEKQVLESSEERTFQYQDSLPSLPVPPLDESLSKYLDAGNDSIL